MNAEIIFTSDKTQKKKYFSSKTSSFNLCMPQKKENGGIFWISKRGVKTSQLDGISLYTQYK